MKKIPTIYQRDPATKLRYVKDEPHADCGWVFDGEGVPTYKWDGSCVMIDGEGVVWKRREVKADKEAPHTFQEEGPVDPNTGKRVGWVLADLDSKEDQWLAEAYEASGNDLPAGTYEFVGPKSQGNPHGWEHHQLIPHGTMLMDDHNISSGFDELGQWLHDYSNNGTRGAIGFEGIVWHHPDGRMAKIKVRDFPKPTQT